MLSGACVRSCLLQGDGAAVIHPPSLAGNPCDQMASMKKLHDLDLAPRATQMCMWRGAEASRGQLGACGVKLWCPNPVNQAAQVQLPDFSPQQV